jgi:hypothetical protein
VPLSTVTVVQELAPAGGGCVYCRWYDHTVKVSQKQPEQCRIIDPIAHGIGGPLGVLAPTYILQSLSSHVPLCRPAFAACVQVQG